MIAECAADLLAKVRTVAALANSASLSIGGRSADPGMLKIPLPAAWVTLRKDVSDERDYEHGPASGMISPSPILLATFAVTIFVPYIDDNDLLAVQYPLLESIISTVHANESPSGYRWRYAGQRIALVYPDRLAYEQHFTVDYIINPT